MRQRGHDRRSRSLPPIRESAHRTRRVGGWPALGRSRPPPARVPLGAPRVVGGRRPSPPNRASASTCSGAPIASTSPRPTPAGWRSISWPDSMIRNSPSRERPEQTYGRLQSARTLTSGRRPSSCASRGWDSQRSDLDYERRYLARASHDLTLVPAAPIGATPTERLPTVATESCPREMPVRTKDANVH